MRGRHRSFLIIIGAIIAAILSGCSGKKERALSFSVGGAPSELAFWEKIVGEFEGKSGLKVTLLRQPTDTDQRRQGLLIPLTSGHSDPDVFLMDVAWISQIAASGWLEPLDGMLEEIGRDTFFEGILTHADRYKGKLIALPVYIDGGILYYRKDILQEHGYRGPPETWIDLVEMSLKVQAAKRKKNRGFYGYLWQGAQYEGLICNFIEFAASNGGGIILRDEGIRLNTPENIDALNLMKDMIHKHGISPPNTFTEMKEEEVRSYFQSGNALFERNWPYAWALHQADESMVKGKTGIAPLPHFPSGRSVSTLGGWHIGISTFSDAKRQARSFVAFILSYDIQKKLASDLGWNSGRRDIYTDPEILEKLPHLAELKGIFENALPRPSVPYYTQISSVIQAYINAALSGKMEPETALIEAEKESQKIIERYAVNP